MFEFKNNFVVIITVLAGIATIYGVFFKKDSHIKKKNKLENNKIYGNSQNIKVGHMENANIEVKNIYNKIEDGYSNETKLNTKTKFASRLDNVLEKINYNKSAADKVTIKAISNDLNISENEINKYYMSGSQEPENDELIKKISNLLGVNYKWLSGIVEDEHPFKLEYNEKKDSRNLVYSANYDYDSYISGYKIIIDESDLDYQSVILQQKDKYKYLILFDESGSPFTLRSEELNKDFNYSAVRFCLMINELKKKQCKNSNWVKEPSFMDDIYFVDKDDFQKLIDGHVHANVFLYQNISKKLNYGNLLYDLFTIGAKGNTNVLSEKNVRWFNDLKELLDNYETTKKIFVKE